MMGNAGLAVEEEPELGTKERAESGVALGKAIRMQFPLFGQDLVNAPAYLDSAASSQKPRSVIETFRRYLSFEHANIHRGAYRLSANATRRYDEARAKVAAFIGAPNPDTIVFTGGTTASVNLVARAFEKYFRPGDVILVSYLEHHSNIVPWQMLAQRKGLRVEFAEISQHAEFDLDDYLRRVKELRPRFVAITALSNAFGTVTPLPEIIDAAHGVGAKVLVDGAQAVAHTALDVQALDADFLVFSAHKMYGPTGIGALYGKGELLEEMDPFLGGGDMIERVTTEGFTAADYPRKFEAGTPPIAEAIAFGAAVDFIQSIGIERIHDHEQALFEKLFEAFRREPGVIVYGPAVVGAPQGSILSFNVEGVHPHDLATVADAHNVQLRAGHHCAMPAMKRLGIPSTARISLAVHSDEDDIEAALEAVRAAKGLFA